MFPGRQNSPHPADNAARAGTGVLQGLGIHTLLGRIVLTAVPLLAALALLAWVMNSRVQESSGNIAAKLEQRQNLNQMLRHMVGDLLLAEQALQTFLLLPSPDTRRDFEEKLAHVREFARELHTDPAKNNLGPHRDRLAELHRQLEALEKSTSALLDVRVNPSRLFPAMPIMLDRMQPHAEQFFGVAMLAVLEAQDRLQDPGQTEVLQLFYDTLYTWSRMIDAFRLYIANRFGIFDGSIETAMRTQDQRVIQFSERVQRNLDRLAALDRQGRLEVQQQLSLKEMRALHAAWTAGWRDARAIWSSDRWRFDTPMVQNDIRPLFDKAWHTLHAVQDAVEALSGEDLTAMSRLAGLVTNWLWYLVLLGALIVVLMLALFEKMIRRPVARVAAALKAEAAGRTDVVIPETSLQETRDLALAFRHMRDEVRVREEALNTRERRLQTILDNTAEGIITFDEHGVIEGFNQSAERLFGWLENEVLGTSIALLIAPQSRETRDAYTTHFLRAEIQRLIGHEGELFGRHRDGNCFPMAVKISGMELENRRKYIALVSNISERKAYMENLRRLAEHDGLTGLYNRSYFTTELERLVDRVRRSEITHCALLYIDLDHFKYVNDTLGHAAGDRLLIEVSGILSRRARKSDLVARLGGDEFTILVYDAIPTQVARVADSFRRQLADYDFSFEGQTVTIGCSIGVAVIDPTVCSPTEIMSRADLACHLAKRAGRNQVHVFTGEDAKNVTTMSLDMGWSRRIREAIDKNRFQLAVQPIVSTRSRTVSTWEVLVRMQDENGELIMPSGFLPTAERFGLSLDIDRWVITRAIQVLAAQHGARANPSYTINLSAQSLNSPELSDLVHDSIRTTGVDPGALIFEITETAAIADMNAAVALLGRLRALGCRTALDDFGSGMSSFAYLKELPVDIVKIDGRFVRHIATSAVDQAMVRAMNDIAHALGKETIAEFVEDEAAYQTLVKLGVDYAQGYHLGRPEAVTVSGLPAVAHG